MEDNSHIYFIVSVLFAIIVTFLLFKYSDHQGKTTQVEHENKIQFEGIDTGSLGIHKDGLYKFELDGHEYLCLTIWRHSVSICHKADCKYCKKGE